jgi:hypothetical protein
VQESLQAYRLDLCLSLASICEFSLEGTVGRALAAAEQKYRGRTLVCIVSARARAELLNNQSNYANRSLNRLRSPIGD